MTFIFRRLTLFLFLGVLTVGTVEAQSDAARLAGQLLDIGADGEALRVLGSGDPQADGATAALGAERSRILSQGWSAAFREDLLRADVIASISQAESPSSIQVGIDWLRTPEVSRVTERLRRLAGQEGDRAFLEWLAGLNESSLDRERSEIIAQISERSGETDAGEVVLALAEAGIRAGHAAAPPADRPSLSETLDHFHVMSETIGIQSLAQNRLYLYFVLNDLTLAQLRAYADALNQPGGRWYVRVMNDALLHAIHQATNRLVTNVERGVQSIN